MIVTVRSLSSRVCGWLAILLASSACIFALDPSLDVSQYAHSAWKIREGFTKGTVFSMAQTPDGYLWLGTEFGLVRFDGVQAKPWQPPKGEQLPSIYIRALLVTRDGTLWIGTAAGIASWKNGKLTGYPEVAGYPAGPFLQDGNGTVWVGIQHPGKLCTISPGKIECYGTGRLGNNLVDLYADHKGQLWVAAQTGLWRWGPGPPMHFYPSNGPVEAKTLTEGDNGALLVATGAPDGSFSSSMEGLKQFTGGRFRSYELPGIGEKFRPTCLFRSSDGSLWIGTVQGLLHLHEGKIDKIDDLSGNVVTKIFEDREGNVWVSTEDGLDRFSEFAVPTISVNQGLSNSAVHVVEATQDGSIWIATANGLDRWRNGHVTVYGKQRDPGQDFEIDEQKLVINARVTEIVNGGLKGAVYSLGEDDKGRLWTGSPEGVFLYEGGRFFQVPGIHGGNIFSFAAGERGKVWISSLDQGLIYSSPEGVVQSIPWARLGRKLAAVAMLPDPVRGGLWLGFYDGGVTYLVDGEIRASYNSADGLGKGSVTDLQLDSDGAVWAATAGGLSRIKDGHITTLASKNGLPCDGVHWMVEGNDHSIWLNQPCGLVRIARSELVAWESHPDRSIKNTVFDNSDGVRARITAGHFGPKVTKSIDGKIWFTPLDGVSIIDPEHLPFNKLPPPVHIEQVTADDKPFDIVNGMQLPARVRDLDIDYTALSLVAPEKVRFRFKLDGEDKNWREVVNVRHVEYSNLSPGNYHFHVIACNNSDVWNEQGASLDFAIAPAYYQTMWFRMLCVVTLLAMLWTVYRLRVRVLEHRQVLLERNQALLEQHQTEIRALNEQMIHGQEAERIRISGELHDGILQQITSLSLRLATVKYQFPSDSEAKATINGLQEELIKMGTDIRHLSHELHPAMLQDSGLPAALSAYCNEFSKVRGFPVSYEADQTVQGLSPGAALCLYRIAQEALGNAAKHSEAKKVEVRLVRVDGRVRLSVSDDGVGCDPSQVGKSGGLGLINMRERVLQLDGTLEFDSIPGRGSTVKVEIPFRPAS